MKPTEELFNIIKENFADKDAYSIDDVEVFDFLLCDNSYNASWRLRLSNEFVRGYANKANDGKVAITIVHDNKVLALGKTIKGYAHYDEVGGFASALAKIYTVKGLVLSDGIKSDDIINHLNAGTTTDGSIEFYAEDYKCSICGNDISDWEKCGHVPGYEYDGEFCYAIVGTRNAVYSNYSIVTDGSLERAGLVTSKEYVFRGEKYYVPRQLNFGIKDYKLNIKQEEAEHMEKEKYDEMLKALNQLTDANNDLKLSVDRNKALEEDIAKLKDEHSAEIEAHKHEVSDLKQEIEKLESFKEAYYSILEEEGVRAYGTSFDKVVFENKTVDELENARKGFIETSLKKTNSGRVFSRNDSVPSIKNEELYKI